MTERFTPGWAEALGNQLAALGSGPGGSGVVEWVVSGDPDRVWVRWEIADGRVVAVSVSDRDGGPDGAEVEVTVPLTRAQAEALLVGEADPAEAYMRGDLKPEGSSRAWFALLSAFARPDHREVIRS